MKINQGIFKAYDIRGKFPSEINEATAERIGASAALFFAQKLKKKKITVLVCRDVRISSPILKDALVRGLNSQGVDVVDVGIGTTPFFYFLMHGVARADGGIMVTASHNPAEYNGFKLRSRDGSPVSGSSGILRIKSMVLHRKFTVARSLGRVLEPSRNFRQMYISYQAKNARIGRISAVVDASGGAAAYFLPEIFAKFPEFKYKPLFFQPDGSFAKHSPNPLLPESQKFVASELKSEAFQFGALFDGDADRVVFFDEKGNVVRPDFIAALFMEEELKKHKKSAFVFTVNTSRGPRDHLREKGARIEISKVGFANVQPSMRKVNALVGTEISGHFFFKKFEYDDSAIMAFLKLAGILSRTPRSLSQLVRPYARYVSSEELNFSVSDREAVLEKLTGFYEDIPGIKISRLDGITFEFPEWWFNVRSSNTEPLVRLVMEASTEEFFAEKLRELKRLIQ